MAILSSFCHAKGRLKGARSFSDRICDATNCIHDNNMFTGCGDMKEARVFPHIWCLRTIEFCCCEFMLTLMRSSSTWEPRVSKMTSETFWNCSKVKVVFSHNSDGAYWSAYVQWVFVYFNTYSGSNGLLHLIVAYSILLKLNWTQSINQSSNQSIN